MGGSVCKCCGETTETYDINDRKKEDVKIQNEYTGAENDNKAFQHEEEENNAKKSDNSFLKSEDRENESNLKTKDGVTQLEATVQKPEPPRISTKSKYQTATDGSKATDEMESKGKTQPEVPQRPRKCNEEKTDDNKAKRPLPKPRDQDNDKEPDKNFIAVEEIPDKPSSQKLTEEVPAEYYEEIDKIGKEGGEARDYTQLKPEDEKEAEPGNKDTEGIYTDVNSIYADMKGEGAEIYVVLMDYKKDSFYLKKSEEVIITEKSGEEWEVIVESRRQGGRAPRSILAEPGSEEIQHLWHMKNRTDEELVKFRRLLLKHGKQGDFFVRPSKSTKGDYALSLLHEDKEEANQKAGNKRITDYRIVHINLENKEKYYIFRNVMFLSLEQLVNYYKEDSDGLACKLAEPCPRLDLETS